MAFIEKSLLAALMINATHYIDIGAEKDAVIYYENATQAHMRLPDGKALSGKWTLQEDGYEVAWTNGPSGSWKLSYAPGRVSYVNGEGKEMGSITRIVYGNAERLPN